MRTAVFLILICFASGGAALSQELPSKIRGYKVYRADITVHVSVGSNGASPKGAAAEVKLGEPTVVDLGLAGLTVDVPVEIIETGQSGKIDFITFRDFQINGVPVEVEEYSHPFSFKSGVAVRLPVPARVVIRPSSMAKTAFRELIDSKKDWSVTGRVFIFGHFKKYGLSFKRVVPVNVTVTVPSPLTK